MPVPDAVMDRGRPVESLGTVRMALRGPMAVGIKRIAKEQLEPGASVCNIQSGWPLGKWSWTKSLILPLLRNKALVMVMGAFPVLVIVTI